MVRIINVEPHDEDNKGFLKDSIGQRPIVAAFHMPGCMYCDMLKDPWNKFTNMLERKYRNDETIVAFIHKDVQDDVIERVKGYMFIGGYPTIVGIKKGGSFEEFKGKRTSNSLLNFYNKISINKKIKKNRNRKGGSLGSVSTAKNLSDEIRKEKKIKEENITKLMNIYNFIPTTLEHGIPRRQLIDLTRKTLKKKYDIPKDIFFKDNSPVSSLGSQGHESTKPNKSKKRKRTKSSGGKRKNKHKKTKKSKKMI